MLKDLAVRSSRRKKKRSGKEKSSRMIIKYVNGDNRCGGLEEDFESYGYIEDCADVTTEKITLEDLMIEFKEIYKKDDKDWPDWQKVVKNFFESCEENYKEVDCDKQKELARFLRTAAESCKRYSKAFVDSNSNIFIDLAEVLLGDEAIDKEYFHDARLKMITYKRNDKWYTLFTLGVVYLLNDSGKTIDMVK